MGVRVIYIYDILLNWTDPNVIYDFYAWQKGDGIEHVKRLSLFKVEKQVFDDFLTCDIIVDPLFLERFQNSCEIFKNKKIEVVPYACCFSDGLRAMAVEFSEKGEVIAHSKMLLDEEEDVVDLSTRLDFVSFSYQKKEFPEEPSFLTRQERERRVYLRREIKNAYTHHEEGKLRYLYQEYFDRLGTDITTMYQELLGSLADFTPRHHELYQLLRLTHTKKQV